MCPETLQKRYRPIYVPGRTFVSGGLQTRQQETSLSNMWQPTYCGFSTHEGTSIFMRLSAGARGPSRNGGNIHVHTEIPIHHVSTDNYKSKSRIKFTDTSGNYRRRFQELIRMSSASNYREELVTGPGGYFPEDCSRNKQPSTVHCLRQNETATKIHHPSPLHWTESRKSFRGQMRGKEFFGADPLL
jgi:hypothetical protein